MSTTCLANFPTKQHYAFEQEGFGFCGRHTETSCHWWKHRIRC